MKIVRPPSLHQRRRRSSPSSHGCQLGRRCRAPRSRRSPRTRTRCRAPPRCCGRGWSARSRAARRAPSSSTRAGLGLQQVAPEAVGQRLVRAPPRRRRMPAIASQPACATTPKQRRRRPRGRRASSPITRSRRGTQNSSATIDRVDHSAPIQVAPTTNGQRRRPAPAKPRAPTPARVGEVERGLVEERLDAADVLARSAAARRPPRASASAGAGSPGSSRHCCRNCLVRRRGSGRPAACASAKSASAGVPNLSQRR